MAARVLSGHLPLGIRSSYAFLRARAAAAASSGVAAAPVLPFAGAAATVLAAAYFYTYESEDAVINRMCGVFERGGTPGWDRKFVVDLGAHRVPRPALQAQLLALLSPPLGDPVMNHYAVVVGANGTGKSTAMRMAVRAQGASSVPRIDNNGIMPDLGAFFERRGAHGAVYFLTPSAIGSFSTDLMRALDYREPFSLFSPFRSLVSKDTKASAGPQISRPQPLASWMALAPMLQAAAERFKLRHGRPPVLVLDATDLLAKKDPAFFSEVQEFAKECADEGFLRIVFVFSDGCALPLLESNAALSRSTAPFEIGEISDAEAVAYLLGLGVKLERAEALVKEVAGGRFPFLHAHAMSSTSVKDIVKTLHNRTKSALMPMQVLPSAPLFRALLARKEVSSGEALSMVDEGTLFSLLRKSILAIHPNGGYTFNSRHVESFFAKEVAAAVQVEEAVQASRWWR